MKRSVGQPPSLVIVTLLFGILSIPLAFLRHLCTLSVILGTLALLFAIHGQWQCRRTPARCGRWHQQAFRWGGIAAAVGTTSAIVMWMLWAGNSLLR
jgi:hypothetical protein